MYMGKSYEDPLSDRTLMDVFPEVRVKRASSLLTAVGFIGLSRDPSHCCGDEVFCLFYGVGH